MSSARKSRKAEEAAEHWSADNVAWDGVVLSAQGQGTPANVPSIDKYYVKGRGTPGPSGGLCRVPGCGADLSKDLAYFRKYRICREHLKSPLLMVEGTPSRFCQQCSRFHHIKEFDGAQRTCRAMLERLRQKRKTQGGGGRSRDCARTADTDPRSPSRSNSDNEDDGSGLAGSQQRPAATGPTTSEGDDSAAATTSTGRERDSRGSAHGGSAAGAAPSLVTPLGAALLVPQLVSPSGASLQRAPPLAGSGSGGAGATAAAGAAGAFRSLATPVASGSLLSILPHGGALLPARQPADAAATSAEVSGSTSGPKLFVGDAQGAPDTHAGGAAAPPHCISGSMVHPHPHALGLTPPVGSGALQLAATQQQQQQQPRRASGSVPGIKDEQQEAGAVGIAGAGGGGGIITGGALRAVHGGGGGGGGLHGGAAAGGGMGHSLLLQREGDSLMGGRALDGRVLRDLDLESELRSMYREMDLDELVAQLPRAQGLAESPLLHAQQHAASIQPDGGARTMHAAPRDEPYAYFFPRTGHEPWNVAPHTDLCLDVMDLEAAADAGRMLPPRIAPPPGTALAHASLQPPLVLGATIVPGAAAAVAHAAMTFGAAGLSAPAPLGGTSHGGSRGRGNYGGALGAAAQPPRPDSSGAMRGGALDEFRSALPEAGDVDSWVSAADIDAALDTLMEEAGEGALYGVDHSMALERVCLKLHNVHPSELPHDLLMSMSSWLAQVPAQLLQGAIRPGCTQLILDVYVPVDGPATRHLCPSGPGSAGPSSVDAQRGGGLPATPALSGGLLSTRENPPAAPTERLANASWGKDARVPLPDAVHSAAGGGKGAGEAAAGALGASLQLGGSCGGNAMETQAGCGRALAGLVLRGELHAAVCKDEGEVADSGAGGSLGDFVTLGGNVRDAVASYAKLLGPRASQSMAVSVGHQVLTFNAAGTGRHVVDVRGTLAGQRAPLLLSVAPLAVVAGEPASLLARGAHLLGAGRRAHVRCQGGHVPISGTAAVEHVPQTGCTPGLVALLIDATLPGSHRDEALRSCADVEVHIEPPAPGLLMLEWEGAPAAGAAGAHALAPGPSLSGWLPVLAVPSVAMALEVCRMPTTRPEERRRTHTFLTDLGLLLDFNTRVERGAFPQTDAGAPPAEEHEPSARNHIEPRDGAGAADQLPTEPAARDVPPSRRAANAPLDSFGELQGRSRVFKKHLERVGQLTPSLIAFAADAGMSSVLAWLLDFSVTHVFPDRLADVFDSVERLPGGGAGAAARGGLPLLHRCVRSGAADCVRVLLDRAAAFGMECNFAQGAGAHCITALHLAALQVHNAELLATCVYAYPENGSTLWHRLVDAAGRTPAMYAAQQAEKWQQRSTSGGVPERATQRTRILDAGSGPSAMCYSWGSDATAADGSIHASGTSVSENLPHDCGSHNCTDGGIPSTVGVRGGGTADATPDVSGRGSGRSSSACLLAADGLQLLDELALEAEKAAAAGEGAQEVTGAQARVSSGSSRAVREAVAALAAVRMEPVAEEHAESPGGAAGLGQGPSDSDVAPARAWSRGEEGMEEPAQAQMPTVAGEKGPAAARSGHAIAKGGSGEGAEAAAEAERVQDGDAPNCGAATSNQTPATYKAPTGSTDDDRSCMSKSAPSPNPTVAAVALSGSERASAVAINARCVPAPGFQVSGSRLFNGAALLTAFVAAACVWALWALRALTHQV